MVPEITSPKAHPTIKVLYVKDIASACTLATRYLCDQTLSLPNIYYTFVGALYMRVFHTRVMVDCLCVLFELRAEIVQGPCARKLRILHGTSRGFL